MSAPDADPPIFRPPPPPLPSEARAVPPVSTQPPSPDVAAVSAESGLPGEHRGGFSRLPTAPVGIPEPVLAETPATARWSEPEASAPPRGLAGWALVFGVAGLGFSFFVGWAFPIGLVAVVVGVLALRRPWESRGTAVWAISLGAVSVLYSAGWLLWAASRANLFG